MKANWGKVVLWFVLLLVWVGAMRLADYAVDQYYAKYNAADQLEQYTNAYKMVRMHNTFDNLILIVGLVVSIFFIYKMIRSFKVKDV